MSNSGDDHWKATVRVLKYLRFTQNYGLYYNDANWISDTKDSKSTSGYVFMLGG